MSKGSLAIILARAGSKGLANKNALMLHGKPMIGWTIEHALASKHINRVVVTTDGEALAQIAYGYGVEVVRRPEALADDTATVDAAARHAIDTLSAQSGSVVMLYGNVPVRPHDLTDRALQMLYKSEADSVQSVCAVGKQHPYWMKTVDESTGELGMYVDNHIYRRQDLPPVYMLDGGVIAVTRHSLMRVVEGEPHAFLGEDRRAVVTQPGEVVDVDNEADFKLAESVMAAQLQSAKTPRMRTAG